MEESKRYYFVDEAGDLTLFNKKGKVIIGQEGCSKYFILGIAQLNNPHETRVKINELRNVILSDAYLQGIPSVQRKTKYFFHAKDDCPASGKRGLSPFIFINKINSVYFANMG